MQAIHEEFPPLSLLARNRDKRGVGGNPRACGVPAHNAKNEHQDKQGSKQHRSAAERLFGGESWPRWLVTEMHLGHEFNHSKQNAGRKPKLQTPRLVHETLKGSPWHIR
jgi:hypothetical protein